MSSDADGRYLCTALLLPAGFVAAEVVGAFTASSLNLEGPGRHILTDLYDEIGAVTASAVTITTDFSRADAIASLFVVGLMVNAARGLLRDRGRILLEAPPHDKDLKAIRSHLLEDSRIRDIHDLQVWTETPGLPALSTHAGADDSYVTNGHAAQLPTGCGPPCCGTATRSTPPSSSSPQATSPRTARSRMTLRASPTPSLGTSTSADTTEERHRAQPEQPT